MVLRPALFLDRDGVINVDHGYVGDSSRFEFMPGIFELVRHARALGYAPVVVTNQSGIARGMFSEQDFAILTDWMCARFSREDAALDAVYHCPYHPEAGIDQWRADHAWRKPRPGMLLAAANDLSLDLPTSIMIGDKPSDMEAGRAAGIKKLIFLSDSSESIASTKKVSSLKAVMSLI